jgi:hypothetical protein
VLPVVGGRRVFVRFILAAMLIGTSVGSSSEAISELLQDFAVHCRWNDQDFRVVPRLLQTAVCDETLEMECADSKIERGKWMPSNVCQRRRTLC